MGGNKYVCDLIMTHVSCLQRPNHNSCHFIKKKSQLDWIFIYFQYKILANPPKRSISHREYQKTFPTHIFQHQETSLNTLCDLPSQTNSLTWKAWGRSSNAGHGRGWLAGSDARHRPLRDVFGEERVENLILWGLQKDEVLAVLEGSNTC